MNAPVLDPIPLNDENAWRTETPGPKGWARSPRPGAANKYFIASVDSHITPPIALAERLSPEHRANMPRVEVDEKGTKWQVVGDMRFPLADVTFEGEDNYRQRAGVMTLENGDAEMTHRLADMDRDGIDYEIAFPNGWALATYGNPDFDFALSVFRHYNDWAADLNSRFGHRSYIVPCITTYNVADAVKELHRIKDMGHTCFHMPTHPHPKDHKQLYNQEMYEPLWSAIEELELPMLLHVATGGDPRRKRGPGGAIINRQNSHDLMAEVITTLCCSGVFDRHPKLRFNGVEGGGGWLPALMDLWDETYLKHHFWIKPKLKHGLPSDYFREHGMVSFQEDRSALLLCEEYNLSNNITWSSDYPHHEGTFPHSAAAIERQFGCVSEETRAKILGLNAARFLGLEVPAQYH